ncbi:hypothetical protein HOA55_02785 [archaeon]|jgi:hypothetical protein|nr:hypothetical protein [archaeon]MBT6820255.1 hypothetical protein [archaeon]MBT6956714.1 hypothetical protein [archaeon]MBT7025459.1 hypothetical protein [archaeon]MBT7239309.1 hypothetical protein [archaeon]
MNSSEQQTWNLPRRFAGKAFADPRKDAEAMSLAEQIWGRLMERLSSGGGRRQRKKK